MSGGGGGGGDTTTVQKADPWEGVQPYLSAAYAQANQLYANGGPQYYPGATVAQPDPLEAYAQQQQLAQMGNLGSLGGQGMNNLNAMSYLGQQGGQFGYGSAVNAGNAMQNLGQAAQGGIGNANAATQALLANATNGSLQGGTTGALNAMYGLQAAGDPQNNPYFAAAQQAAIRPVTQQFQEQVLPGIKQGAQAAGQMGGSRQGIAEGIASRGYLDTVGDITANMGTQAYGQGLQAMAQAGQLGQGIAGQGLGALQSGGALGAQLGGLANSAYGNLGSLGSSLFGSGNQALGQGTALVPTAQGGLLAGGQMAEGIGQQLTADRQANLDDVVNRWNYNQNLPYTMLSDYMQLLQGAPGGQTTSSQSGGGSNRLMSGLGGAATGAALGSAFMPGIGTGIGAGAGALLGLFM